VYICLGQKDFVAVVVVVESINNIMEF